MSVALLLDRQNPFVQVRLPEPPYDTAPVPVLPDDPEVLPGGVGSDVQIGTDDVGMLIDDGGEEGSGDFVEKALADTRLVITCPPTSPIRDQA